MKKSFFALIAILIAISATESFSQGKSAESITASELESYVTFLASPGMKGRDKRSRINFDYSLSGRQHPLQLFARSDHYNFVKKDIPVLFFTTGLGKNGSL